MTNEKAIEFLEDYFDASVCCDTKHGREFMDKLKQAYDMAIAALREQPVAHGRWDIRTDDCDCEYARCSECGEEFYDANEDTIDITFNYCPNCGARMDGDGNG